MSVNKILRNKKAQSSTITAKFLVEIIIFVIIFFIFLRVGAKVWQFYVSKPQTVTQNSYTLLAQHIKYFDEQITDTFPLQVDERHIIKGFDKENTAKPELCDPLFSCLCICSLTCEKENIVKCKTLESSSSKEIRITDEFIISYNEIITNYFLELDEKKRISVHLEIQ